MSRKHFESIARALRDTGASLETCLAIAAELAFFNAAFNRSAFLSACGH